MTEVTIQPARDLAAFGAARKGARLKWILEHLADLKPGQEAVFPTDRYHKFRHSHGGFGMTDRFGYDCRKARDILFPGGVVHCFHDREVDRLVCVRTV